MTKICDDLWKNWSVPLSGLTQPAVTLKQVIKTKTESSKKYTRSSLVLPHPLLANIITTFKVIKPEEQKPSNNKVYKLPTTTQVFVFRWVYYHFGLFLLQELLQLSNVPCLIWRLIHLLTTTWKQQQQIKFLGCVTVLCRCGMICLSASWSSALQKWLNRSRCRLSCGLRRAQGTAYQIGVQIPHM